MGYLSNKLIASVNQYAANHKGSNRITNKLNDRVVRLAEKQITRGEGKLLASANKELARIGINGNDLLSDDALKNPRAALTKVARNKLEVELAKHNIPTEILNPENIKNPEKFIKGYTLDRIGNELEKHNIPRELVSPDTLKNPKDFLVKYATGELNKRLSGNLAKYNIPSSLITDLANGKIKTQQDVLTYLKEPLTQKITAELRNRVGNIQLGKTNLTDAVGNIQNIFNSNNMTVDDVTLYAQNQDVLGTNNKIANTAAEMDAPVTAIANATAEVNSSAASTQLQYPLGRDSQQCCMMIITAFEYQYDPNDILGNRRSIDAEIAPNVKNLYEIRLPMPAGLASTFTAQWEDYSNVFGKLARTGMSNLTEGMTFDMKDWINKLSDLYQNNPAVKDAAKVGMFAGGAAALFSGAGIGGAINTGIDEALNYLRVAGGLTINPMTQAAYVGSNIRSHKFTFNLAPRNKAEHDAIYTIIKLLEDSNLPARRNDMGGILLDFPDTFNIRFVAPDGNPINGILEIPDSVITNISVVRSHGTGTGFKVTKDYFPISYQLDITFKEMENLVRQDLKYLRQSAEQYKALHSGGSIPADWDPNNALKDIKPFDIGTVAAASSTATETPSGASTGGSTGTDTTTAAQITQSSGKVLTAAQVSSALGGTMPDAYTAMVNEAVAKYPNVPRNLVIAVMKTESSFKAGARSPVGAMGLMQLMPGTAKDLGVSNAYDPRQNIMGGTKYLSQLMKTFNGNLSHVIAAYNAGPGNVRKHHGVPPFRETQNYVRDVTARYNKLNGL